MRKHALGVGITFPAMALVLVKAKSVIETLRFRLGLGHKPLTVTLEKIQLILRDFEVRHNRAAFVYANHGKAMFLVFGFGLRPEFSIRSNLNQAGEHESASERIYCSRRRGRPAEATTCLALKMRIISSLGRRPRYVVSQR